MLDFRCGLLEPPADRQPCGTSASSTIRIYQPDEVKDIVANRVASSEIFKDPRWVKDGDQSTEDSCAGWACATSAAKTAYIEGVADQPNLHGGYIYGLCNHGQRVGGSQLIDCMNAMESHGAPPVSIGGPHLVMRNQTAQFDTLAAQTKSLACIHISNEQELDSAIAARLMVCVCVQVTQAFKMFRGAGILPAYSGRGNHAVHVDDIVYINGVKYYRLVNNWGLYWGTSGVAYVTFASFKQTIGIHYFYAQTYVTKSPPASKVQSA